MTALVATRAVLAATPPPPSADADPVDVIEAALAVIDARSPHLEALRAKLERDPHELRDSAEAAVALAEIRDRDASWQAALARAHHILRQRQTTLRRIRTARGY